MEQKLKMLKSLLMGLNEEYQDYCDTEFNLKAPLHWNREDKVYEAPDYEKWIQENCLTFKDWLREECEHEDIEDILDCAFEVVKGVN